MSIKLLFFSFVIIFLLISASEIVDFYEYYISTGEVCKLRYEILIDHDINKTINHIRENVTVFVFKNGSIKIINDSNNIMGRYSQLIRFVYLPSEDLKGRISGFRAIGSYSPSFESLWINKINDSNSLFLGLIRSNFDNIYVLANQARSNSTVSVNVFLTEISGFRCFKLYYSFYIPVLLVKMFLSLFLSASIVYIHNRRKSSRRW